jgi:hypothetical protein
MFPNFLKESEQWRSVPMMGSWLSCLFTVNSVLMFTQARDPFLMCLAVFFGLLGSLVTIALTIVTFMKPPRVTGARSEAPYQIIHSSRFTINQSDDEGAIRII